MCVKQGPASLQSPEHRNTPCPSPAFFLPSLVPTGSQSCADSGTGFTPVSPSRVPHNPFPGRSFFPATASVLRGGFYLCQILLENPIILFIPVIRKEHKQKISPNAMQHTLSGSPERPAQWIKSIVHSGDQDSTAGFISVQHSTKL